MRCICCSTLTICAGRLLASVPAHARPRIAKIALECNVALGGFIRGQLLVAAIVGVLIIVLLELLHVPMQS